jgi:tripartite ATP-independent transporter DctM subunit
MGGIEVIVLFLVLIILGLPIGVSMGLTSILSIIVENLPINVLAHRMGNAINSFPLLAVPVFIFAGCLMNTSGITQRIFTFVRSMIGGISGGLAHVNVIASLIFSGMSGAALADIGGLGNIEIEAMQDQGYRIDQAAAITAASATIGPIFPPSIPLIIYATVAEVSGVRMLIAGIIPGLLLAMLLGIEVALLAKYYNFPRDEHRVDVKTRVHLFIKAFPALLTPFILVGGLLSGMFSPTEVAGFTVFYALLLGVFVYKELTWQNFKKVARDTIRSTANIMFIVSSASIFAFVLTIEQVPAHMKEFLLGISDNSIIQLLLANLILLITGMIIEPIAALLVLTPILVPTLTASGVDPIHLGIVIVLNLMIGLLTPPVGMSLYLVSIISKIPVQKVIRAVLPYFIPLLLALLIVTLFPSLSTWLPGLFFKR